MKTRLVSTKLNASFSSLSLLAVLLAACAPATATQLPALSATPFVVVEASATPFVDNSSPTLEVVSTEALIPTALPAATSRGPDLEATDPTTVSMASGSLQLVEFFEFW